MQKRLHFIVLIILLSHVCYPASQSPEYCIYSIEKGDTLWSISRKFGISVDILRSFNRLSDDSIPAGGRILIPSNNGYFVFPVKGRIISYFGKENGCRNIGIRILPELREVQPSASGVVIKTGSMRGYGNFVMISHDNGITTVYANLKTVLTSVNAVVSPGTIIGLLDTENCSYLHFELHSRGIPQDPLAYLK